MSRHHAEWLQFVDVSGPFLEIPVLDRVFPQGLDALDGRLAGRLFSARDEWAEVPSNDPQAAEIHQAWIEMVLREVLDFDDEVLLTGEAFGADLEVDIAEHHESSSPDWVLADPADTEDRRPRLLVQAWPQGQDLRGVIPGRAWSASPAERMTTLCRGTGVRLGLVTNGEHWMLVDAPAGQTPGYASWYTCLWQQEPLTLRAFRSLLGARRFFAVAATDTLVAMLTESVAHQQEVTDQLGRQVRQAVEVLVQSLDRADQDRGRELLQNVSPERLYDAALTVMMRLVFLFCAEERGLLLLGDEVYDANYAVSTLRGQLREEADRVGEEILAWRRDAWTRLLSTFRAVFAGIEHETLRMPALGGGLFDPDRYPFLEGRVEGTHWKDTPASPLPIDNRTVLHLLESLQLLQQRGTTGGRLLSFAGLDVENIGHVYEGLLDHVAVRVERLTIGLTGAQGKESEIAISTLEEERTQSEDALLRFLKAETKRSPSALRNSLDAEPTDETRERFLVACGNDQDVLARVIPYHALIRQNVWGYPVVYRAGAFMVTTGAGRRQTGTHYTEKALTEEIVGGVLEPLVYDGPAEGKPREEWQLRSPSELLDLKICDMAMGSAAFLVQVCRWLAERLVEAWERAQARGKTITADGLVVDELGDQDPLTTDSDERLLAARRMVAERCIYGVDINPMAVELAKLSIWLVTMAKGRPFAFLDHNLRWGDSLLGIHDLAQLRHFHMDPEAGKFFHLFDPSKYVQPAVEQALELRRRVRLTRILDIEDVREMSRLYQQSQSALDRVHLVADLLTGTMIGTITWSQRAAEGELAARAQLASTVLAEDVDTARLEVEVQEMLDTDCPAHYRPKRAFHWPIEFPEVFEAGGFDAIVGNPPFMGGQKITGNLGRAYREYTVRYLGRGQRGSADLCAYFFLRASGLLKDNGMVGLLATNTIAQGDTREVGLEQLLQHDFTIPQAVRSRKWPGTANLEVALVWLHKGPWEGEHVLEGRPVEGITAFLTVPGEVTGTPYRLKANEDKSFQGSIVLGMGFVMAPEEAQALIDKDARNKDVLFPYLNGQDLNSRPDQSASRWVINFFDWPLRRGAAGSWATGDDRQRREWLGSGIVPDDYPDPVAADYPDCLAIVEEKVRPERTRRKPNGSFALRRPLPQRWWIYAEKRPKLYATIAEMERALVVARTAKFRVFTAVSTRQVLDVNLVVFSLKAKTAFSVLQSTLHEVWVNAHSSTLETRQGYRPSDCFETFPFPMTGSSLEDIGRRYYECRDDITNKRQEGLTDSYNHFHDPNETDREIQGLRDLHVEMDRAVASAYSWDDLDLGHDFCETRQGVRFTISETARSEVLSRLLNLNHERYAEEVKQGLHD